MNDPTPLIRVVDRQCQDRWRYLQPRTDGQFAKYVTKPELAGLLPCATRSRSSLAWMVVSAGRLAW